MKNRSILISGAGIAGPSLAYWLHKYGFNPVVVEQAPRPREGGYLVDFRGTGIKVAERMGIMAQVRTAQYVPKEILFVNESNDIVTRMDIARLFRETFNDPRLAQTQILRTALSKIIYDKTRDAVEYVFGDSVRALEEHHDGIDVVFNSGQARRFDILIGADGIHSNVRSLVFGDEPQASQYLGYYQAAFWIDHPISVGTNISFAQPGKFVSLFGFPDKRAMLYAVFKRPDKPNYESHDTEIRKRLLADQLSQMRWQSIPAILEQLETTSDFLFESAEIVQIDKWSRGRVSLVGDAGYPTPLTAWGVGLALIGAYILAGELKAANGEFTTAFAAYEHEFRPFVDQKTKEARGTGLRLVPESALQLWVRNQALKLFSLPVLSRFVARMTYGRMFRESFALKDYGM